MIRTIYPSARRAAICSAVLLLFLAATLTAWKPAAAMTTVTAAPPAAWGAPSEPGAPVTGNVAIAQLKANGQYGALKKAIAAAIPAISQQAYLKASSTGASNEFGYAVAISGNTAVVGAPFEGSSGAAYVFVRSGAGWAQQAVLKASNSGLDDWFGSAVAISGDTIVVGAPNEDSTATGVNGGGSDNSASNSGAAYVYVRSGTNWTQEAYLKASNTGVDDLFGSAVAISGDTIVVGASFESSTATGVNNDGSDNSASHSGAAYVFVRNGESWAHQAYLKASNTEANDWFGFAVAISGDTVVVGAQFEDSTATGVNGDGSDNSKSNAGAAYVFVRSGESWAQQAYLKASNSGVGDEFGSSVAISGDTIVVGGQI